MRVSSCWMRRQIAIGLVVILVLPITEASAASAQQAISGRQAESMTFDRDQRQDSDGQDGKPSSNSPQPKKAEPDNPDLVPSQVIDQSGQSTTPQSGTEQQQSGVPKPVGTAAAPYKKTTGVTASRPSGAVIAPAKQRRVRSILIRVGIVVAAGVAIGTVVALSQGSPSRP